MEIKRSKHAVAVGFFVVFALTIFVLLVFMLGGEQKRFTQKFPLKVVFTDINGLKEGNNVWFSGVKIGTVNEISLKDISNVEVTLYVDESVRHLIHKNATAKISSEGFLGNKIVIIYGGDNTSPPILDNDYLNVQQSTTEEDVMAILQKSNKNLLEITENIKSVSRKIAGGQGTLGKLLNDSLFVDTLKIMLSDFKTVAAKGKRTVANLQDLTARMNSRKSSVYKLAADTFLYDSIKNAVNNIRALSSGLNAVTENLKKAGDKLNQTSSPAGVLLNDTIFASDLQATMKNLRLASKKLDENLEALQHVPLIKGHIKKIKSASQPGAKPPE